MGGRKTTSSRLNLSQISGVIGAGLSIATISQSVFYDGFDIFDLETIIGELRWVAQLVSFGWLFTVRGISSGETVRVKALPFMCLSVIGLCAYFLYSLSLDKTINYVNVSQQIFLMDIAGVIMMLASQIFALLAWWDLKNATAISPSGNNKKDVELGDVNVSIVMISTLSVVSPISLKKSPHLTYSCSYSSFILIPTMDFRS